MDKDTLPLIDMVTPIITSLDQMTYESSLSADDYLLLKKPLHHSLEHAAKTLD